MEKTDFVRNRSVITDRVQPSPAIWFDCPVDTLQLDPSLGRFYRTDFNRLPLAPTETTQIGWGEWKVFNTGAGIVAPVSAVNSVEIEGGTLRIALDTDNDQGSLASAYPWLLMTGLTSNSGKLWIEWAYAQNTVLTNTCAVMFGLAETELWTLATAVPFNAGDAITASASFIGFRVLEDGLGVVDTVYSDRATSFTNIGAAEGGTLTAYTFKKFGMRYDPALSADCVTFFVDNVPTTTRLSKAALIALTNLDANALGFIIACCADSAGTTFEGYLAWLQVAQINPGKAA